MKFVRFVEMKDPWDLDIITYEVIPSLVVLNGEDIVRYMVPPTLDMLREDFNDETIRHVDLNDVVPRYEGEYFIEVTPIKQHVFCQRTKPEIWRLEGSSPKTE